jgi:hypothetical protein
MLSNSGTGRLRMAVTIENGDKMRQNLAALNLATSRPPPSGLCLLYPQSIFKFIFQQ